MTVSHVHCQAIRLQDASAFVTDVGPFISVTVNST